MKIEVTFNVTTEIEVDTESCDAEDLIEEVEGAIRMALAQPVSLGAGAVELGGIVRSVERGQVKG